MATPDDLLLFVDRDPEGAPLDLLPHGGDPRGVELRGRFGPYIADHGLINAANTALGLELPLLLTGEPGCGKSDFAFAAAHALKLDAPLCCYVRSDTRARDLLYHYDALRRFGDAQHGNPRQARDPRNYVRLAPLGAALMTVAPRQVVLIDEIDKAPRDLPNDLLQELDVGDFQIPELGDLPRDAELPAKVFDPDHPAIELRRDMRRTGPRKPLVIITSNAERQLPEPFLRRCVFYNIPPPSRDRLVEIAHRRFPDHDPPFLTDLAEIFDALRAHALTQQLQKPPTTSEMLEWVRACVALYDRASVGTPLRAFKRALAAGKGKLTGETGLSWADLPGLVCLIKHREDLNAIARHGSAA